MGSSRSHPGARELLEGAGAVRQGEGAIGGNAVLFLRTHLAEGALMAVRAEDGIVAEPSRPTRRKDEGSVHPALEGFHRAVRPGERQHADESRPPRLRRAPRFKFALDAGHRGAKILALARPSRRIDPGRALERLDAKPGIVGERNHARRARRRFRFQDSVVAEGRPRLLGLIETERARAERLDAVRGEQFLDLAQLAGVMGGDDERSGETASLA